MIFTDLFGTQFTWVDNGKEMTEDEKKLIEGAKTGNVKILLIVPKSVTNHKQVILSIIGFVGEHQKDMMVHENNEAIILYLEGRPERFEQDSKKFFLFVKAIISWKEK